MARSGTGIGYTPSQTSTSMPGSFDEEQTALARKRLMLQQLANAGPVDSGYHGSHWVNPYLGQLGSAITGAFANNEQQGLDKQAQDIAQRRGAYTSQLLSNPPQMEDIPAVPGMQGTGPVAPPPGTPGVEQDAYQPGQDIAAQQAQQGLGLDAAASGETGAPTQPQAPMVPKSYEEFRPNVADTAMVPKWDTGRMLKWAGDLSASSPMGAKIADKFIETKLDEPRQAAIRAEKSKADMDKLRETLAAKVEAAQATQSGREFLQQMGFNQQEYLTKLQGNDKEYFIRLAAALKPEKGDKTGEVIPGETLAFMADRVLAGDKSPMLGLGYGASGAANRIALQNTIVQRAKDRNISPEAVSAALAEFGGVQAGERVVGARGATMEMAGQEAEALGALVRQTSEQVGRTEFVPVNKALLAYEKNTGDVPVKKFGAAINSFVNAYARAISPTGVPSVSDKNHAREMLEAADSNEQVQGTIDQLNQELAAARASPGKAREGLRATVINSNPANAPATPATPATNLRKKVEAAGQTYAPDKYEYRIGPDGSVQRRAK